MMTTMMGKARNTYICGRGSGATHNDDDDDDEDNDDDDDREEQKCVHISGRGRGTTHNDDDDDDGKGSKYIYLWPWERSNT